MESPILKVRIDKELHDKLGRYSAGPLAETVRIALANFVDPRPRPSLLGELQRPIRIFITERTRGQMGDQVTLAVLSKPLSAARKEYSVHLGDLATAEAQGLLQGDVICVGGETSNEVTRFFLEKLGEHYEDCRIGMKDSTITINPHLDPERSQYPFHESQTTIDDYGLVIWARNPLAPTKWLLVLAGGYALGTFAAVQSVVDNSLVIAPTEPFACLWQIQSTEQGIQVPTLCLPPWKLRERPGGQASFEEFWQMEGRVRLVVPFATKDSGRRYQTDEYIRVTTEAAAFCDRHFRDRLRRDHNISTCYYGDQDYFDRERRDNIIALGAEHHNATALGIMQRIRQDYGRPLPAQIRPLGPDGKPRRRQLLETDERCLLLVEDSTAFTSRRPGEPTEDFVDYGLAIRYHLEQKVVWLFQGLYGGGAHAALRAMTDPALGCLATFPTNFSESRGVLAVIRARIVRDYPTEITVARSWLL